MKHIKLFEEFLYEAEGSDTRKKAESICKKAVTEAQKEVEKLLNDAKKAGMLNSYKTKIVKLNHPEISGFSLQIDSSSIKSDLVWQSPTGFSPTKDAEESTPQELYFSDWLTSNCTTKSANTEGILLMPSPFFIEEYDEKNGRPYFEGSFFSVSAGSGSVSIWSWGNLQIVKNKSYDVKDEADMGKVAQEWLTEIKKQLDESRSLMGL